MRCERIEVVPDGDLGDLEVRAQLADPDELALLDHCEHACAPVADAHTRLGLRPSSAASGFRTISLPLSSARPSGHCRTSMSLPQLGAGRLSQAKPTGGRSLPDGTLFLQKPFDDVTLLQGIRSPLDAGVASIAPPV